MRTCRPRPRTSRSPITGLPAGRPTVTHYRVDAARGNSYEKWKAMGSPQPPTPAQIAELERAGQLTLLGPAERPMVAGGRLSLTFELPRQGVSLVKVTW